MDLQYCGKYQSDYPTLHYDSQLQSHSVCKYEQCPCNKDNTHSVDIVLQS